jgi:peptide/nickel transport system substrate-binding protein
MRLAPRSRTVRSLTAAAIASALLLAAPVGAAQAQSVSAATESPASETTLRIATSGFVDTFNPFISIYLTPTNIIRYVYESLVQNDAEDGSPTKGLADSWEATDGGQTWTFTLQDDLVWSDGEPITSADVKYTYDQMMTVPALGTANGNLVSNFDTVETPDDKTVVITLKTPQAPNPGSEIPIVPKHIWEEVDDPTTFTNDADVVGSGPFVLDSYSANQSIVLKANENFWRGAPKIDAIQYVYYTNSDAQVQALKAGDVDLVTGLTPTQFSALEGVDGITTHSGEGRRYHSISINVGQQTRDNVPYGTGNAALKELEVRQAIRLGTDTATLLDKVLDGEGTLATSFIPASFPKWHLSDDDDVIVGFDPEAAQAKLDEAGWVPSADGIREKDGQRLSLRLLTDADDANEQSISDFFVPWMKDIGIEITVESTDSDTISAKATSGDYDLYFSGWSVNPDPDYQLGINTCMNLPTATDGTGGTTQDGYCNPEFDEMYAAQRSEIDAEKRQEIVHDMLALNYTDTAQVATWYANSLEAYRSDRFTGFTLQPKGVGALRYFLVKLGGAAISLAMVILLGFFAFKILPGDPVASIARERGMSAEQADQLREQLGLNKPLWQQFIDYLGNVFTLNFGTSYVYRTSVSDLIGQYFWNTILLTGTAAIIAIALGLWLGQKAAWKHGSTFDRIVSGTSLVFWSVPTFWLALLLLMVFGGTLHWFPTGGMVSPNPPTDPVGAVLDVISHMVLPVITMVAVVYAQYLMVMRSSLLEEMGADYLTTARAKGLREDLVRRRHAVPNALLPTVTLVFMHIGGLIAGAVTVETVFSWPGLGKLTFEAISGPDLPLLQGTFVVFSTIIIAMNLIADLIYRQLDPRVRRA